MSHAVALPPPVTIAAFDAFLEGERDDSRWELIDGEIVAMTNPSLDHAEIVANIASALRPVMPADRRCRVTAGDVRVQMSDDLRGIYAPRPDVMVWCGPKEGSRNFVTTPQIIVEVLSQSNMDHDRGAKLRLYKTGFPTLRQIVLVYQDQMRVECCERTDIGWELLTLTRPEQTLMFTALVFGMTLAEVYAGVALPSG